jgi:hypothetical protein
VKNPPDPNSMSKSSIRSELLDHLTMRFPERKWRKLVILRELADFTIQHLDHKDVDDRSQRTLYLAEVAERRLRRERKASRSG